MTNRGLKSKQKQKTTIQRTNHLLVIGIDKYENIPVLHNAVKDAEDVIKLLKTDYQFEQKHITTIFDKAATEGRITAALRKLTTELTSKDNLIIYFSGHGYYDEMLDDGYWIPVEGYHEATHTYIGNDTLCKYLKKIKAHHIVLIMDSCYSGSLFDQNRDITKRLESRQSRWAITSGMNEPVADGEAGKNSPFAKALLTVLSDTNTSKVLISEVANYVRNITARNAKQTPRSGPLSNVDDMGGEFVFHKRQITQTPILNPDEVDDIANEDTIFWNSIKDETNLLLFKIYLDKYPNGKYADIAAQKVHKLTENATMRSVNSDQQGSIYDDPFQDTRQNPFTSKKDEKAHKIIEQHIMAIGGREKIEAVKDIIIRMNTQTKNGTFQMTQVLKTPHKERVQFVLNGQITQEYIFDGQKGFFQGQFKNQELQGDELIDAKKKHLFFEAFYEQLGYELKYRELITDDYGSKLHVVEWTTPAGHSILQYYDTISHLKVYELTVHNSMFGLNQTTGLQYTNYQSVEGVLFPLTVYEIQNNIHTITYQVFSILLNIGVNDNIFSRTNSWNVL